MDEAHYLAYGANFLIENLVISLGRFVPWDILSLRLLSLGRFDRGTLWLGTFYLGTFCLETFCLGTFCLCTRRRRGSCPWGWRGGENLPPEGEEEERTSSLRVRRRRGPPSLRVTRRRGPPSLRVRRRSYIQYILYLTVRSAAITSISPLTASQSNNNNNK